MVSVRLRARRLKLAGAAILIVIKANPHLLFIITSKFFGIASSFEKQSCDLFFEIFIEFYFERLFFDADETPKSRRAIKKVVVDPPLDWRAVEWGDSGLRARSGAVARLTTGSNKHRTCSLTLTLLFNIGDKVCINK